MSTSLFGAVSSSQNPFAVGNNRKDATASPFNFVQPSNTFGSPSIPISTVFGSKTGSSSSTEWQKLSVTNSGNSQIPLPKLSRGMNKNAANTFGSTPNLNRSPFQPCKAPIKTSELKSESNNLVTPQNPNEISTANENSKSLFNSSQTYVKSPSSTRLKLAWSPNSYDTTEELPTTFAEKIRAQLQKDEIYAPSIEILNNSKGLSDFFKIASDLRLDYMKYREKVRVSLIKVNLLDDPNVPKKLKDAIDFKGTCDLMCPEYECLTRIVDRRYDKTERDIESDGSLAAQPNPAKMVKALSRSAAGQDAPLPGDIRTAAALKRTVDYLFNTILAERELESVHGFMWDRTRAIRRDFVFHSTMASTELVDQVYCLERIIRFHVISLHHMSKDGIPADGFSDQQEREQLSKSLLSLIHAYDDCKLQGVHCENEIEFKAYYILFNGEIPGIMETVQNWGWDVWESSEIIRIAVSLSESLQNTWDFHGPLNPTSTMEISQNSYARFFTIVEDPSVSYTMACFAEIYFNKVRKAILRTILCSYRKQRGQTKDWTPEKLNIYLRFDNEEEVEPFVELYGLHFIEADGEWCLSFNSTSSIQDPHPLPKQPHSYYLVERKRGKKSLSEAINKSIYEPKSSLRQINPPSSLIQEPTSKVSHITKSDAKPPCNPLDSTQIKANQKIMTRIEPSSNVVKNKQESFFDNSFLQNTTPRSLFNNSIPDQSLNLKIFPTMDSPSLKKMKDGVSIQQQSEYDLSPFKTASTFDFFKKTPKEPRTIETSAQFPFQNSEFPHARTEQTINSPGESKRLDYYLSTTPKFILKDNSNTGLLDRHSETSNEGKKCKDKVSTISIEKSSALEKPLNQASPVSIPTLIPLQQDPLLVSKTHDITYSKVKSAVTFDQKNTAKKKFKKKQLDHLTEWIVQGDEGLLEQFCEIQAKMIVDDVFTRYNAEQLKKSQERARKQAEDRADEFRQHSLSVKFGYLWRELARRLRLRRRGREARLARLEMAKHLNSKKTALSSNLLEEFQVSTSRRRQRDMQSLEACDTISKSNEIMKENQIHKRKRSEKSFTSDNSSPSSHQTLISCNLQNRSLLSDSSYLCGQSRIHLLPHHLGKDDKRTSFNGVKSDYFRLKARGIETHVKGIPLSNVSSRKTHHRTLSGEKRTGSFRKVQGISGDMKMGLTKSNIDHIIKTSSLDYELDMTHLNLKARKQLFDEKRLIEVKDTEDDNALFDRAKRVREQLDEGAEWFRKEIERGTDEF